MGPLAVYCKPKLCWMPVDPQVIRSIARKPLFAAVVRYLLEERIVDLIPSDLPQGLAL